MRLNMLEHDTSRARNASEGANLRLYPDLHLAWTERESAPTSSLLNARL